LDSPERHEKTRTLVGSIHRFHEDVTIIIFGFNLLPKHESELKLWGNTEYYDIKEFVVTSKVSRKVHKEENNFEYWIPIIIQRAAQLYGSVLYIDSSFILLESLAPIQDILLKEKSYFVSNSSSQIQAPFCDDYIQGYVYNGFAYKNILLPKIKCHHKKCSKKQKGLLYSKKLPEISESEKNSIKCRAYPKQFTNDNVGHEREQCYILFKDNFLFTHHQLPSFPKNKNEKANPEKIKIGVGFPATSKGVPKSYLDNFEIPFLSILLPSILNTTNKNDKKYQYNLYLGFDTGDPFYDNLVLFYLIQGCTKKDYNKI
jgi:hypothetical protein